MTTKQETDMSEITVVEFENSVHTEETYLSSELADGPPYTVHGVALGAGDVTKGKSGIEKKWPAEELKKAAETLQGTNLVVDHENNSRGVVGKVTKAGYKDGTGVVYEAELYDEDLAERIDQELLEVSVRGLHEDVESLREDEESGALLVENIEFKNLSIVPSGASPSNTLEIGEHAELSAAELASFTEGIEAEASSDDGQADSQMALESIEPGMWVRSDGTRGITISQIQDGEIEVDIYEESDGKWRSTGETEMYDVDSLDPWDVDEEEDIGAAEDEEDDESEDEESEESDEEEASEHKMDPEVEDDKEEDAQSPEFEEGMMVQWQVNPDMFGEVVHVPEDDDIVMVEVMEQMDGEMKPTGFTVTAGYSDLMPFDKEELTDLEELESYSDYPDAAQENAQMALDAREETGNPNDCGTDVGWTRANQLASGEALSKNVVERMAQFNRHRQNNDMSDEEGEADCGWMMWKAWGGDEGVDWAIDKAESFDEEEMAATSEDVPTQDAEPTHRPMGQMADLFNQFLNTSGTPESTIAEFIEWLNSGEELSDRVEGEDEKLDTKEAIKRMRENDAAYIPEEVEELTEEEELQEYEMHEVSWDGTTESDWSKPAMEDFDTDDLSEIASHFIISTTGFPPENFGDLKLPVVEPNGDLNLNALAAVKGGRGVSAVEGLSSSMEDDIVQYVNGLAEREFDKDWSEEEASEYIVTDVKSEPTEPDKYVGGVRVLPGDDLRDELTEASTADSMTKYEITTMNEQIEEKLSELEEPVAVEAEELTELQDKADRFEELSENIEALRERTDILDDVDRSQVEELAETDDAVVVESAHYEELQSEAEEVKGVYAAQLAENYEAFDAEELADKFSIEELREKFEDQFGSVEELADSSEAEPRSQDPSEEELEEEEAPEEGSEAELSEEVAAKQDAIRQKLNIGGD